MSQQYAAETLRDAISTAPIAGLVGLLANQQARRALRFPPARICRLGSRDPQRPRGGATVIRDASWSRPLGAQQTNSSLAAAVRIATVCLSAPDSPRLPPGPGNWVSNKPAGRVRVSAPGLVTTGRPGEKERGPQNLVCYLLKRCTFVTCLRWLSLVKISWGLKP